VSCFGRPSRRARRMFDNIKVPTLIIRGGENDLITPADVIG
jgi:hypothetical protein